MLRDDRISLLPSTQGHYTHRDDERVEKELFEKGAWSYMKILRG